MRKVGVEIEFTGDPGSVIDQIRAAGFIVQDARHTHNTGIAPTHWCVKRDGSIGVDGEVASPPLDFDDPEQRDQITRVVKAMQRADVSTGVGCGVHVHVEATNADGTPFSGKQIAAVVRFVYKFEDAIYRIASSGWRTIRGGVTNYAKPIPEQTARAIMKARTVDSVKEIWNGNVRQNRYGFYAPSLDRYTALNLHSYFYRNTIEFRHFNSSLNPARIQTYVALCQAIMEDARQGHSRQVSTHYPLGSMKAGLVDEDRLFLRLQQILTTESKDTHRLMGKEDWKNLRKLCWNGSVPQEDVFHGYATNGESVRARFARRGGRSTATA